MKNVRSANYLQVDHKIKNISVVDGVEILPIRQAFEKYEWVKRYFPKKPEEGYFFWIKKQISNPLFICVSLLKTPEQKLNNLIIVEKNLNINIKGTCNSIEMNQRGSHISEGKIVLKENSTLKYEHMHHWGAKNKVEVDYEFILQKNSKLEYVYKIISSPEKLDARTKIVCFEDSSANMKISGKCENTNINLKDVIILKEKNSSGILKLRLVGKENSKICAHSKILTEAGGKGHLDCQGLPIDKSAEISLIPELVCKSNQAQITHEASIGKISEEELQYLKSRGLSEKESIDLIVCGFLE